MLYYFIVQLLQPFTILLVIVLATTANLWHKRQESRRRLIWLTAAAAALYLFCMPLVAHLMLGTLEWQFPPAADGSADPQTIVVLSGGVYPSDEIRPKTTLDESSLYRCLHALELYRGGSPRTILVTGGKVDPHRPGPTLAVAMRDFLVEMGVPADQILMETASRSTYENAKFAADLLHEREIDEILLVTDAAHMRRSVRCFETQGLDVVPAPCRFRATNFKWSLFSFLPSAGAAQSNQAAFHEWLGMLWYWLKGRI